MLGRRKSSPPTEEKEAAYYFTYDMESSASTVEIKDLSARSLRSVNTCGTKNVYVLVWSNSTRNAKQSTAKYHGDNSGVWNDTFDFIVPDRDNEFIFFEVRASSNLCGNKIVGRIKIPCKEITSDVVTNWYDIFGDDGSKTGEIQITSRLRPQG